MSKRTPSAGKGDSPRPILRADLNELGYAILREKDPDKKDELIRQWYELRGGKKNEKTVDRHRNSAESGTRMGDVQPEHID